MGPNKCCFVWKSIFTTIYIYIYIKRENRSQNYYAEQFTKNTIWITCFSFFLIQVLWLNLLNVSMQFVNCVVQLVIWMWWRDWWVVIVFFFFFIFYFLYRKRRKKEGLILKNEIKNKCHREIFGVENIENRFWDQIHKIYRKSNFENIDFKTNSLFWHNTKKLGIKLTHSIKG